MVCDENEYTCKMFPYDTALNTTGFEMRKNRVVLGIGYIQQMTQIQFPRDATVDNVNVKWEGYYWDTCDIEFSLIADFPKFEQFYSGFEIGLKLASFTR